MFLKITITAWNNNVAHPTMPYGFFSYRQKASGFWESKRWSGMPCHSCIIDALNAMKAELKGPLTLG